MSDPIIKNSNKANPKAQGLFAGLSETEVRALLELMTVRRWTSGERITREGEIDNTLYLIQHGQVDILKKIASRQGEREEKIASLREGDSFGEMALLDQLPRSASVVANSDSVLLALDDIHLQMLNPRIFTKMLVNITREVSRRLRAADQHFAVSLFSIHEQARFRLFPKD
jgi:CRP-like cAMP-binding protein